MKNHFLQIHTLPLSLILLFILAVGCSVPQPDAYLEFEDSTATVYGPYRVIKLPIKKGVKVLNPVQISLGPGGKIFAANQSGELYTLQDSDGDGVEDEALLFADLNDLGLESPAGFAHKGDTVYVGTRSEIRAFRDIDQDGKADTSWTFFNKIPVSEHPYEWTSSLNFGQDGWLYFVLTTDSWNPGASPDPEGLRGSILKVAPDGQHYEIVATGIRSIHGMNFNPEGNLFFADNKGGGNPTEELNLLQVGNFYGHNPKKYEGKFDTITPPVFSLENEIAPSGIEFNKPKNDFGGTGGDLFVAFYGPGERWNRGGVGRVKIKTSADSYEFEEFPVADIPKISDLTFSNDGSLYLAQHGISDYWYNPTEEKTGSFFKLIYDPDLVGKHPVRKELKEENFSSASLENGKQLFAIRACSACHGVDGTTDLIGPNLKGSGKEFSQEEFLEEIKEPSKRIKPGMIATRIALKDGKVLLGRIVYTDANQVSIMLVGNQIVKVAKEEILSSEEELKSLMYENLLAGLSEEEIKNLLNYLSSL
ncbi:MAG TPA: PQQ-dependent sugar dehydrogenase [Algoriphagus sp.]|nr:PQQ-dependent sugar dehydrogenase [Algoriphagus sp.]